MYIYLFNCSEKRLGKAAEIEFQIQVYKMETEL